MPRHRHPAAEHDRDRRCDRHRPVLCQRQCDCPSRTGRRAHGVRHHGSGGVLHDAVARRNGDAIADSRFVRGLCGAIRRPLAGLCGGLELLVQLGHHPGRGIGGGRSHRAILVSPFKLHAVGHGLFLGAAGLESPLGQGLRRSGILVRRHQGRDRDHLPGGGRPDDCRHAGRSQPGLPELDLERPEDRLARALRRRLYRGAGRVPGGRLFLPGHRRRGPRRRGNHQSDPERSQGDPHGVLAHPVVLHRLDLRGRHLDQLHRPQSIARR